MKQSPRRLQSEKPEGLPLPHVDTARMSAGAGSVASMSFLRDLAVSALDARRKQVTVTLGGALGPNWALLPLWLLQVPETVGQSVQADSRLQPRPELPTLGSAWGPCPPDAAVWTPPSPREPSP